MSGGSLQLREYPAPIVRLSCEKRGRAGQYRKQNLIAFTVLIFACRKSRSANGRDECTIRVACATLDLPETEIGTANAKL
jgi:hypothetical protein